jgi:triacylglycerol lipase
VNDPIVTGVRDWLANFTAALVPPIKFPGLVHLGFIDQLRLIHDDMVADLNTGFTPPLYVTGHSQGGAVAALATKALEHDGIEVAATYTFAAPLPCENMFKSSVKTPVFRLEFGDDIVPHVPLEALPLPVDGAESNSGTGRSAREYPDHT